MMRWVLILFCGLGYSLNAQVHSVKLFEAEGSNVRLAPALAISSKDPQNLVVATADGRTFYSMDQGATWKAGMAKPFPGYRCAPSLLSSAKGEFFYFHSLNDAAAGEAPGDIVCQHSDDGGATWEEEETIWSNSPKSQDLVRAVIQTKKHELYASWTQYDKFGASEPDLHSNVMFSMSS